MEQQLKKILATLQIITAKKNELDRKMVSFNKRLTTVELKFSNRCDDIEKKGSNMNNIDVSPMQNYTFVYSNSKNNWGSVVLYVPNHLQYTKREKLSFTTADFENLFIEVNVKGKKRDKFLEWCVGTLITIFQFFKNFAKLLKKLALLKQDYYNVGDRNVDFLKCSNNQKIDSYRNDLLSEGCFNLMDKPTRVTANSSTSINHLYTNNLVKSIQAEILNNEISDHLPLFCLISYSPKMEKIKYTRRCSKKFNADRFLLDVDDLL